MVKKEKYKCIFCEKSYNTLEKANECFAKHDLLYVPMTVKEMNQFIRFIYEQQNPPITLISRMKKIMKKKAGKTH